MVTENLQKKIDRAIRLLQGVQNGYDGEIEVAYSGGKDSDVILQLAKEAGIRYRAIYRNTTIDPPGRLPMWSVWVPKYSDQKKRSFRL